MNRRNPNDREVRQSLRRVWWPTTESCVAAGDSWWFWQQCMQISFTLTGETFKQDVDFQSTDIFHCLHQVPHLFLNLTLRVSCYLLHMQSWWACGRIRSRL